MTDWMVQNSLIATALATVVALVCRFNRTRPALCHLLWLLVFVALVAPPLPMTTGPGTMLREQLSSLIGSEASGGSHGLRASDSEGLAAAGPVFVADFAPTALASTAPASVSSAEQAPSLYERLSSVELGTWLLTVWIAGAAAVLFWQQRRIRSFHGDVRRASLAPNALSHKVAAVAEKLGVRAPEVRVVPGVGSPSVWCFGPLRLLWPVAISGGQAREAGLADPVRDTPGVTGNGACAAGCDPTLIAHELAHIARKDHWVSRCEAAASVLLWWHPLYWVIRRQVHDYSELSCDAWALWAYPADRRAYAEALIEAQERTVTASIALQGLCATERDTKDFERRLNMIMKHRTSRRVSRLAATAAILATTLVLPGFSDDKQSAPAADGVSARSQVEGLVDAHRLGEKAEKLFGAGEFDKAKAAFQKQLELDADNGRAHARMGYILIGQGDYESASWHLEQQVTAGYRPEVGVYNMACAASLAGNTKGAMKSLRRAVSLGFADTKLLAGDSDLAAVRGHDGFQSVVANAEKVQELRESITGVKAWFNSDDKLKMKGALAEIVSGDGKLQHELGLALLTAGKTAAAAEAFARQASAGYLPENAHYNLACVRAQEGDTEAALAELTHSAKLGMRYEGIVSDDDLASLRGNARYEKLAQKISAPGVDKTAFYKALKSGDEAQAAALLEKICAGESNKAAARKLAGWGQCELGKVALANGQSEQALTRFHKALDVGYPAEQAVFHMAAAYAKAGDEVAALQHVEDALTLGFAAVADVAKLLENAHLGDELQRKDLVDWAQKIAEKSKSKSKKGYEKKKAAYGDMSAAH